MAIMPMVTFAETESNPLGSQSSNIKNKYVAKRITIAPALDGNIDPMEYGLSSGASASLDDPVILNSYPFTGKENYGDHQFLYKTPDNLSASDSKYLSHRVDSNDYYFAHDDEYETFYQNELIRLKKEQGITDDTFYHYDTPLTVQHETEALLEAGFGTVKLLNSWENTYTLRVEK
jgi:hypothetical protein